MGEIKRDKSMKKNRRLYSCLKLWDYKKLKHSERIDALNIYSINELEQFALELYHPWVRDTLPIELLMKVMDDILHVRVDKLDKNFIWTDETVNELVRVNEMFVSAAERTCTYVKSLNEELEKRRNSGGFLMDYEIEIRFTPYLRGYEKFEEESNDCFMLVLCEPLRYRNGSDYNFEFSFERYFDKEENYNSSFFLPHENGQPRDCLNDKFISRGIYELKDSRIWSFYDIININRIAIDVKVEHLSFFGDYHNKSIRK